VEPLGLEMIAGALTDRHEAVLLDLRLGSEALASTLRDFRPQLVGISSSFTTDIYRTIEVAQVAKQADPGTFVVVGGHHPSLRPQDFWHSAVDAIVVGEGEVTARELIACLESGGDPARVPGLVLNREEGQRFTLPRPFIENLDLLPHPRRSLTRTYRRHYFQVLTRPIALVETARGCPYRCRFCSVWHFYQGKVRFKSPRRVVEELMEVEEPHVLFTDDNFLADTDRAAEIAGLIKERGIRKGYQIQARSDAIVKHPELIAQWQEVGLGGVFIGFEKPDQVRLDAENKHNSVENNEGALEVLRRQGIEPTVSFIVDPEYDRSDFATLRAYVHRLKLRWPTFSVLTPLPGTALFEQTKEQLTTNNYELFDLLHAVLPTRLPLAEFYDELAGLWRTAYPLWKQRAAGVYLFLRELCSRGPSPACWRMALAEGRRLIEARTYLADLSLCHGTASTQPI
ncbi:MAG: B12-binding domain-containing radical SAM protein, partial [Anaerolineae bacterium]